MANIKSAKKRARQSIKRRERNVGLRSRMRTYIKRVAEAIQLGDPAKAQVVYREATSVIDSTTHKGIIKTNKARRHKSRLNAQIKAMVA